MTGKRDIDAVREMVKAGYTDEDFRATLAWYTENGKTIRTVAAALGSLSTSKLKRVQASNARKAQIKNGSERAHDPIGL